MDSKALYDLYKPLWDEVPETRPRLIRPDEGGTFLLAPLEHFNGWEYVRDDDIVRCGFLEPEDGADRCRVAAVDFLTVKMGCVVLVAQSDVAASITVRPVVLRCDDLDSLLGDNFERTFSGPTLHHALVAAALAVAKARKDQAG